MPFSFSTTKIILKNIGFEVDDEAGQSASFYHKHMKKFVLIGYYPKLDDEYIKQKLKEIQLPFEYFKSLSLTVRKLKKR